MTDLQITHQQLGTWDIVREHDYSTLLLHMYYWLQCAASPCAIVCNSHPPPTKMYGFCATERHNSFLAKGLPTENPKCIISRRILPLSAKLLCISMTTRVKNPSTWERETTIIERKGHFVLVPLPIRSITEAATWKLQSKYSHRRTFVYQSTTDIYPTCFSRKNITHRKSQRNILQAHKFPDSPETSHSDLTRFQA